MSLIVGQRFGNKLIAGYSVNGLYMHMKYKSGKNLPANPIIINWEEWERFVAWVEFQQREKALEKANNS
jgi:hypothetical protein